MQDVTPLLFLVGIALIFWLLLLRPQAKRQRELAHMQSSLGLGDEVMLTSGVYGTIRALDEQVVHVEVASGVTLKVARGAVGQVVHDDDTPPPDQPDVSEEN